MVLWMMVINLLFSRPRKWTGCSCDAFYSPELLPEASILDASRRRYWGIEMYHLFPFLFFFGAVSTHANCACTGSLPSNCCALLLFHCQQLVGTLVWEMALLSVLKRRRTDAVSWNLMAVLNQTSWKLFTVKSYGTLTDQHRF